MSEIRKVLREELPLSDPDYAAFGLGCQSRTPRDIEFRRSNACEMAKR